MDLCIFTNDLEGDLLESFYFKMKEGGRGQDLFVSI